MKPILIISVLGAMLITSLALAQESKQITVSESNPKTSSNTSKLSFEYVNNNAVIIKNCTGCHSIKRINSGLNNWFTLSASEYKDAVSSMITKKTRMLNGELTRNEGQQLYKFLLSLYGPNSKWSP
ncbi:MAG: hypothetical protein PHF56_03490 [Desulfuromonadaceae bacterium]|nr:hypothetical protein [Desulfuromonadaceae bacterium]